MLNLSTSDTKRGGSGLRHPRGWRFALIFFVALSSAAFAYKGAGGFLQNSTNRQHLGQLFGLQTPPVGQDPFLAGGQSIASSAAASSVAGFTLPVPNSVIASPANLTKVWFEPGVTDSGESDNQVFLDYVSSNTRIEIAPALGELGSDPKAEFTAMAASLGMPASSVQAVNGVPALVQPPTGEGFGYVEFVWRGLRVSVTGTSPVSDLMATAASIQ